MNKVLFLIDGNYLMYRSFWGIRGLTTSYGLLVNAVYGFLMSLGKALDDIKPTKVAVIFDGRGKTWRHELVEKAIEEGFATRTYKDRKKSELENFYQQMDIVKDLLGTMNISCYCRKATESDDIISTLVKRYDKKGYETALFTKDQDFYQLLRYNMRLYKPDAPNSYFSKEDFKKKFIVKPRQWCFVGALMGDGSDTIDGIRGIGPKKACLLAKKYHTLKKLVMKIKEEGSISEFGCTLQRTDIRKLRMNYKLKKLADVENICDVGDMVGINRKALRKLFKKYEIESLPTMRFANALGGIQ